MITGVGLDALLRRRLGVKDHDLPPYRGYSSDCNRSGVATIMNDAGFLHGAEVGVLAGVYSEVLCRAMPGLKLKCIDPWAPYQSGFRACLPGREGDAAYETAKDLLRPYLGAELLRMTSAEAAQQVPLRSLDFVVIDGDHEFDATMMDLILWSQRVRVGGLVMQHDFEVAYRVGVMPAVLAYVAGHGIREWYVTRDRVPYALWVNP